MFITIASIVNTRKAVRFLLHHFRVIVERSQVFSLCSVIVIVIIIFSYHSFAC